MRRRRGRSVVQSWRAPRCVCRDHCNSLSHPINNFALFSLPLLIQTDTRWVGEGRQSAYRSAARMFAFEASRVVRWLVHARTQVSLWKASISIFKAGYKDSETLFADASRLRGACLCGSVNACVKDSYMHGRSGRFYGPARPARADRAWIGGSRGFLNSEPAGRSIKHSGRC
eukprot:SAG11_NODE_589_length_8326_cov_11.644099_4_plen_172_part_00